MPVDKSWYPHNWPKASRTIRRIAGDRCEWCGIANGAPLPSGRKGRVVLTVAHLGTPYADGKPGNKHDKHDIRRENLAALCQACHLRYDLADHIQHARETRQRKKLGQLLAAGQLPLFNACLVSLHFDGRNDYSEKFFVTQQHRATRRESR